MSWKKCLNAFALITTAVVLAACGGGGGGETAGNPGTPPPTNPGTPPTVPPAVPPVAPATAPTLSLQVQAVKTFRFTWADVAGETEYRLLEDPDGTSGYTRVATAAADATAHDLVVSLPSRINARYILQACNGSACVDSAPVQVSGNLAAGVGYVKASNTQSGDRFGYSAALSADGSTLAVGAVGEDSGAGGIGGNQADGTAGDSGAVYVFVRSGGTWVQQAYVKASRPAADDYFGWSVALAEDGNTLAVSAPQQSSGAAGVNGIEADTSAYRSGAVYVFIRSGSTWSQQAFVKASNTEAGDGFGESVALAGDGNTLAVGAVGESSSGTGVNGNQADNSAVLSGAVYVFARSTGAWAQQAYLKASNTGAQDMFGHAVALSADGNTLAASAYQERSSATGVNGNQADRSAVSSGAVYVFTRIGTAWAHQAYVKASNTEAQDFFGYDLALSGDGNTMAVTAMSEDGNGLGGQADNSASGSGAAYVFTRSGSAWSQQAYVKAPIAEPSDSFGVSVALSGDGNVLAVGAVDASSAVGIGGNEADNSVGHSGAVHMFRRTAGSWDHHAFVKAPNTGAGDIFGGDVALSHDGATLAVTATYERSAAVGVGGNQADNAASSSGAAYLY